MVYDYAEERILKEIKLLSLIQFKSSDFTFNCCMHSIKQWLLLLLLQTLHCFFHLTVLNFFSTSIWIPILRCINKFSLFSHHLEFGNLASGYAFSTHRLGMRILYKFSVFLNVRLLLIFFLFEFPSNEPKCPKIIFILFFSSAIHTPPPFLAYIPHPFFCFCTP